MPFISVNHRVLRDVADAGYKYCEEQDKEMNNAKEAVEQMLTEWNAADAVAFKNKWSEIDSNGSTASDVKKSIKVFSDALNASAEEYRKAQEDSYNEAYRLPRW